MPSNLQQVFSSLDLEDALLDSAVSSEGLLRCVFSSSGEIKVGTGTTTRKHVSRVYWFVEGRADNTFQLRQINSHHVPFGEGKRISLEDLKEFYSPEVRFFEEKTIPAMKRLDEYLDQGEQELADGKLYSSETTFNGVLGMDAGNVRALFNLGLVYLEMHDHTKAKDILKQLPRIQSTFEGKNQHLFNELGISLRKRGLFDEAAEYYSQALEYVKDDENLYYNLARANYERANWEECVNALDKSRQLNPTMVASQDLVNLIVRMANNPILCEGGKPGISHSVAEMILDVFPEPAPSGSDDLISKNLDDVTGNGVAPERGHVREGGRKHSLDFTDLKV